MIISPISKGSRIPGEEKPTADILNTLPDNWLCISGDKDTYFTFLKDNKKIRGTQIDFVIISEYGIFFIEAKNVSLIKSEHNNLIFQTNEQQEYDPLYRAIEYPNLAKNWFLDIFRKSKKVQHLYKKSDLKFGIWGTVVISNNNFRITSPQKELKLNDLIQHKQFNIVHKNELKRSFFKKYFQQKKAPHHDMLSQDDIYLLFNIMLNQNLEVDEILTPEKDRTYHMLKYIDKYKISSQKDQTKNYKLIQSLKEEKEELEGKYNILNQEYQKLENEHKIDSERLQDLHKVLDNQENSIKERDNTINNLKNNIEKESKFSNTLLNIITNAFSKITGYKRNINEIKETYENKLNLTKNIRTANFILIPFSILTIIAIIILSFMLTSEISKEPPSPSDIFMNAYNTMKKSFDNNNYDELIEKYKNLSYSFEFLSFDEVTKFNYYLGYSYFVTGEDSSSRKETGVKIMSTLNIDQLETTQILDIYPDIFFYLKDKQKYQQAGELLGSIEEVINSRENALSETNKGLYKLLDIKMFFIDVVSSLNENDAREFSILSYLYLGSLSTKTSVLDFYIEDVHTLIEPKVYELKNNIENSTGLYPIAKSDEILQNYKKLLEYITKIEEKNLQAYETKKNRFINLKIVIYKEIGKIHLGSKNYEKAISNLHNAEEEYKAIKDMFISNIEKLPTYIEIYSLMGFAYDSYGDVCGAYEAYWQALNIAERIASKYAAYDLLQAKVEYYREEIRNKENYDCNFKSEKIKDSVKNPK